MRLSLTRTQILIHAVALVLFLATALFPHFGDPHFRYTGSDPNHDVWNFGVPLATCIYDASVSPYFFIGPHAYVCSVAAVFGFIILYTLMVTWNNRQTFWGMSETDREESQGPDDLHSFTA